MKSLIIQCRCCGARRQFLVDDHEAAMIEAQWMDNEPSIIFNATSPDNDMPFTQSLSRADVMHIQTTPLTAAELRDLKRKEQIKSGPLPPLKLNGILPGAVPVPAKKVGKS